MIRVAVLDDHPAVQAGLAAMLDPDPDVSVVGFAASEEQLWPLLRRTHPDVLVLDGHHPGRDGLTLTQEIKRTILPPAVVLYAGSATDVLVVAAVVAGVDTVVAKTSAPRELHTAIHEVVRRPGRLPPISVQMRYAAAAALDPSDHAILAMRLAGDSPSEIGAVLGLRAPDVRGRIGAMVAAMTDAVPDPATARRAA